MHPFYPVLKNTSKVLTENGVFHVLGGGTLLGALREGQMISYDPDFDLEARAEDKDTILGLSPEFEKYGIFLSVGLTSPVPLDAGKRDRQQRRERQTIKISADNRFCGDIYLFTTFSDGNLRLYSAEDRLYANPRHQIPAWYWEHAEVLTLYGDPYPVPAAPELVVESLYGPRWRTPLRPGEHGKGAHRRGGGVVDRHMQPMVRHAIDHGWNTDYSKCAPWPAPIEFINSVRGWRYVIRNEPEVILKQKPLDEADVQRVLACDSQPSARKLIDIAYITGAQSAIKARNLVYGATEARRRDAERIARRLSGKVERQRLQIAALKKLKTKHEALRRRPIRSAFRFLASKILGRPKRWWV